MNLKKNYISKVECSDWRAQSYTNPTPKAYTFLHGIQILYLAERS